MFNCSIEMIRDTNVVVAQPQMQFEPNRFTPLCYNTPIFAQTIYETCTPLVRKSPLRVGSILWDRVVRSILPILDQYQWSKVISKFQSQSCTKVLIERSSMVRHDKKLGEKIFLIGSTGKPVLLSFNGSTTCLLLCRGQRVYTAAAAVLQTGNVKSNTEIISDLNYVTRISLYCVKCGSEYHSYNAVLNIQFLALKLIHATKYIQNYNSRYRTVPLYHVTYLGRYRSLPLTLTSFRKITVRLMKPYKGMFLLYKFYCTYRLCILYPYKHLPVCYFYSGLPGCYTPTITSISYGLDTSFRKTRYPKVKLGLSPRALADWASQLNLPSSEGMPFFSIFYLGQIDPLYACQIFQTVILSWRG
jgi:hypothetical protein